MSYMNIPFYWERGIGLGSKQGRNGWALGGCGHPEIISSLYVYLCTFYWGESIAFSQFFKELETLK